MVNLTLGTDGTNQSFLLEAFITLSEVFGGSDIKPGLDFEQEEEAIFRVTENLPIDMDVEDSGSLEGLRTRLEKEYYDVVHLSGHANITSNGNPFFIMEDEFGNKQEVNPDELWNEALIQNPPRLLFLSGCRTGEMPGSGAAASFARMLVENYKVQAVLGWGRSVAGKAYFAVGQKEKAKACFEEAYQILTKFLGPGHPAVEEAAAWLAKV